MTATDQCPHGVMSGRYAIHVPCNACWIDHCDLHAALHDYAARMARGDIRYPVIEARRILGLPLVTDNTATEGTTTDRSE